MRIRKYFLKITVWTRISILYAVSHMYTKLFHSTRKCSLRTMKHECFGPSFDALPLFYVISLVILLFVHIILFFCSTATLSSIISCLGDSNGATYQFNTFLLKQWSVTHHLPSIVTDRQVDDFDRLFPGDSCVAVCNRRLPSRITV